MLSRYKALLIVDHKWRDLPGLVAVKVCLEDLGIDAFAVARRCFDASLAEIKPHIIVINSINGASQRYMAMAAKRTGALVAVLPTEGRPQDDNLMKYITGQFSDLSSVDLWLNWSETVNRIMIENRLLPASGARVTGVPRFDFYVPPLRSLLTPKDQFLQGYHLNPNLPSVSWATNFILARHVRTGTEDFLVKDLRNLGVTNLSAFANPTILARKDLEVRFRTLEVMYGLCRRFRNVNFLLKPHPFEDTGDYSALIARCRREGLENIALVTEQYIWDVLNAVDVHIHRLCTTGIEAWLMGIPSINFHMESYGGWNLHSDGPAKEALAGDDLLADEAHLADRLEFYLKGGKVSPAQKAIQEAYMARWFYRVDGFSSLRCAKEIAEVLDRMKPTPVFKMRYLNSRGIAKVLINRLTGRPYDMPARESHKLQDGVPVDFLGQRDKIVRSHDVALWTTRIREALRASSKSGLESPDL